tara:strand:- start:4165 stop:4992 length:828 start_codon:yes stop_codon:yes gene_type:complete
MTIVRSLLLLTLCVALVSASAPAAKEAPKKSTKAPLLNDAGHGSVSGQFLLDGAVPAPKILVKKGDPEAKDGAVCAAVDLTSDELVIDPKTKGIQHIFVYIRKVDKTKIHPKLKASSKKEVVFDQKGCRFTPHSLLVRTDQEVVVKSADACAHNTHTYPIRNKADNFTINANNRTGIKFAYPVAEFLPTTVKCDIHPWMKAYWLILDHPYMAVTDAQGRFTVTGLAPGTYEFRCWHEKVGYVAAGSKRGFSVTIKANQTTRLAPVKVPVAKFSEE